MFIEHRIKVHIKTRSYLLAKPRLELSIHVETNSLFTHPHTKYIYVYIYHSMCIILIYNRFHIDIGHKIIVIELNYIILTYMIGLGYKLILISNMVKL
jgi:hypothetical protein